MANTKANVVADLPPYTLQTLVNVAVPEFVGSDTPKQVLCAQAVGNEIYLGCSNGDLLRFALSPDAGPWSWSSHELLSRQSVPNNKPVDDIIVIPSLSRALVLSERQVLVYTLPALDMIPSNVYKPIRNVLSLAVDEQQLRHASSRSNVPPQQAIPVDFCVIKRQSVSVYHLRDKPMYDKDIPLPGRIYLAKRTGRYLCVADHENYNMIDLETASLFPLLPISQAPTDGPPADAPQAPAVKPFIVVVGESEFLLLSWTGASTLGVFITGDGDPVRGTLEWAHHPLSVAFDAPHVSTLLPDGTVEIHSIDTQTLVQVVPPPGSAPSQAVPHPPAQWRALVACADGFAVPSLERATKLQPTPVHLGRRRAKEPAAPPVAELAPEPAAEAEVAEVAEEAGDAEPEGEMEAKAGEPEGQGLPYSVEDEADGVQAGERPLAGHDGAFDEGDVIDAL